MRILVVADMEGAVGIYRRAQCFSLKPEHASGRACLTADVNYVVAGAFDAGAEHVLVRDTHEAGANIIRKELDPRAQYVGGHFNEPVPVIGDISDINGVMLVASHAMSGAQDAFFPHTFFGAFKQVRVNGQPRGEAFIYASSLAEFGVPVIFNSGGDAAVNESLAALPWIKAVVIPKDEDFYNSPDAVKNCAELRRRLQSAAHDAVRDITGMSFPVPLKPSHWEVVVKDDTFAEKINTLGLERDGDTIRWTGETFTQGFIILFKLVQSSFMAMFA